MADKQISQLPQVGSINEDAAFVLEQDGTAYQASAAQIAGMAGGTGGGGGTAGGESILLIDLADTVVITSDIEDIPNRAQTVDVAVDVDAILAHTGRIDVTYSDEKFPGEVQRASFVSSRRDLTATGNEEMLVLYAAPLNPWSEENAALLLKIKADGTAVFLYRARAAEQADMAEDDEYAPNHIKNNPIKFVDGFTVVQNQPRPTKMVNGENSITVTFEDGSSGTLTWVTDTGGNLTTITYPDGHTVEVS